jgi:hypothetical protein
MRPLLVAAIALTLLAGLSLRTTTSRSSAAGANTLDRPEDPVVMTGADVPSLAGIAPDTLVAFRYDGAWVQIPVQVDERDTRQFIDIYDVTAPTSGLCFHVPSGVSSLFYTDAGTFTGPDSDATLDANDEIAFMARDAGGKAAVGEPAGIVPGSGLQVTVNDPIGGGSGIVYLFRTDGSLLPGAGQQYVSYTFSLTSGPYLSTYDTICGPNPESSVAITPYYSHHFSDRWISDELSVTAGAATGADVLDRHKALFAPGACSRSENTFSNGEGALVANISGPVRAIRSYLGANSGPLTQRDHVFYEQREDIRTYLRVHPISSVVDFFDYSPVAAGMTYYNNLNTAGVTIDGANDSVVPGTLAWEMVTGAQGSLVIAHSLSTNVPDPSITSYYLDDTTPPVVQCTGDGFAYGSSGPYRNAAIPCTDPSGPSGCTYYWNVGRTVYFGEPGETVSQAQALTAQANAPLTFTVEPLKSAAGDTDGDTVANGSDPDDDNDGCADLRESGTNPQTGGQRSAHLFWDFFDVPTPPGFTRNQAVTVGDIAAVVARFGSSRPGGPPTKGEAFAEALAPPPAPPAYHAAYDRTASTSAGQPWRSNSANGSITVQDISLAAVQFGHSCL